MVWPAEGMGPCPLFFPAGEDHPSPKRLEKHPDLGVGLAARSEL